MASIDLTLDSDDDGKPTSGSRSVPPRMVPSPKPVQNKVTEKMSPSPAKSHPTSSQKRNRVAQALSAGVTVDLLDSDDEPAFVSMRRRSSHPSSELLHKVKEEGAILIPDSDDEEDEPPRPGPVFNANSPPPPRASGPAAHRKRSLSPTLSLDGDKGGRNVGGGRARPGQTTPVHESPEVELIAAPGSSLEGQMRRVEEGISSALQGAVGVPLVNEEDRAGEGVSMWESTGFGFGFDSDPLDASAKTNKARLCSICGQGGHNKRSCPIGSEAAGRRIPGDAAGSEDADVLVESKKGKKACAMCGQAGHYRKTCPLAQGAEGVDNTVVKKRKMAHQAHQMKEDKWGGGMQIEEHLQEQEEGKQEGDIAGVSSSARRPPETSLMWEWESEVQFRRVNVGDHKELCYPTGRLWSVLRMEAARGRVAPAQIVRELVDALLDREMLEKFKSRADRKEGRGAQAEHLQQVYAALTLLIPAEGSNRILPLSSCGSGRAANDPCADMCSDVRDALQLLATEEGNQGAAKGKLREMQGKQAREKHFFRQQNVKFLKFAAALAASERSCIKAGALDVMGHFLVAGIEIRASASLSETDLKSAILSAVKAADVSSASSEEKQVVQEMLKELIAANATALRSSRLGYIIHNVEELSKHKVSHGLRCVADAMLGSPRWTLEWMAATWSRCPHSETTWDTMHQLCSTPPAVAEQIGVDLVLKCTALRAAVLCLEAAPQAIAKTLREWLDGQKALAATEGVEDLRWRADCALSTYFL